LLRQLRRLLLRHADQKDAAVVRLQNGLVTIVIVVVIASIVATTLLDGIH
jgi:hypothetical protein